MVRAVYLSEDEPMTENQGRLAGRVVLLTGAAGGIGRVYARRLAREGARLALIDLDGEGVRSLAGECADIGAETFDVVADVSDPPAARRAVDEAASRFGGLDALVNNAALFSTLPARPFEEIPPDELDRVLAVNVRGPFVLCQAVVPHLRRRGGGKIVNVGSGIILSASPGMAHYIASKGAIFAMTRALARELGGDGITVNTLAPGFTLTDVLRARTDQPVERSRSARALARDETPEDLEGTLVYLLSSDSDFVTGQMLVVNGGGQFW
jgi:NAD(P)-dependent dehydrogenase (short-subunit alcohol dehydrogenase family)